MANKKKQIEELESFEDIQETEIENTEEELDMNFPPQELITNWKELYGEKNIYMTEYEEEVFVWRTLRRSEYKIILKIKAADAFYREERICETCVLWPEDYGFTQMSEGKAGFPTVLAEQIMGKSGFSVSEAQQL